MDEGFVAVCDCVCIVLHPPACFVRMHFVFVVDHLLQRLWSATTAFGAFATPYSALSVPTASLWPGRGLKGAGYDLQGTSVAERGRSPTNPIPLFHPPPRLLFPA